MPSKNRVLSLLALLFVVVAFSSCFRRAFIGAREAQRKGTYNYHRTSTPIYKPSRY